MPKYYIYDGQESTIISDSSPVNACAKALLLGRFSTAMVGGFYFISERGFGLHPDGDLQVLSDSVNAKYAEFFH